MSRRRRLSTRRQELIARPFGPSRGVLGLIRSPRSQRGVGLWTFRSGGQRVVCRVGGSAVDLKLGEQEFSS